MVRCIFAAAAALLISGVVTAAPPAGADPPPCIDPSCTPGIQPNVVLGSYCNNTTYYVFGVTDWGRLVFCGSPRRYEPRWFRSPEMHGIQLENNLCPADMFGEVAQAPDGLFLTCNARNGATTWERGDL